MLDCKAACSLQTLLPFICPQSEHLFGEQGSEFDWSLHNLKEAPRELERMKEEQKVAPLALPVPCSFPSGSRSAF